MRINLNVPFEEKDQARIAGAKWDLARNTWYIENKADLSPFLRWMPNAEKLKGWKQKLDAMNSRQAKRGRYRT
jgi:hypothetical protein